MIGRADWDHRRGPPSYKPGSGYSSHRAGTPASRKSEAHSKTRFRLSLAASTPDKAEGSPDRVRASRCVGGRANKQAHARNSHMLSFRRKQADRNGRSGRSSRPRSPRVNRGLPTSSKTRANPGSAGSRDPRRSRTRHSLAINQGDAEANLSGDFPVPLPIGHPHDDDDDDNAGVSSRCSRAR